MGGSKDDRSDGGPIRGFGHSNIDPNDVTDLLRLILFMVLPSAILAALTLLKSEFLVGVIVVAALFIGCSGISMRQTRAAGRKVDRAVIFHVAMMLASILLAAGWLLIRWLLLR